MNYEIDYNNKIYKLVEMRLLYSKNFMAIVEYDKTRSFLEEYYYDENDDLYFKVLISENKYKFTCVPLKYVFENILRDINNLDIKKIFNREISDKQKEEILKILGFDMLCYYEKIEKSKNNNLKDFLKWLISIHHSMKM